MKTEIIKTKEDFEIFLEDLPEGGYQFVNERYANMEEHAYSIHNIIPTREEIIEEVWQGDIKFNFDNVEFEIPDEEAMEILNKLID